MNFGLPFGLDEYVHRIGRTGRMGQEGRAVTLVAPNNIGDDKHLQGVARGICRLIGDISNLPEEFVLAAKWKPDDAASKYESDRFNHSQRSLPCPPQRLKSRFIKNKKLFVLN